MKSPLIPGHQARKIRLNTATEVSLVLYQHRNSDRSGSRHCQWQGKGTKSSKITRAQQEAGQQVTPIPFRLEQVTSLQCTLPWGLAQRHNTSLRSFLHNRQKQKSHTSFRIPTLFAVKEKRKSNSYCKRFKCSF